MMISYILLLTECRVELGQLLYYPVQSPVKRHCPELCTTNFAVTIRFAHLTTLKICRVTVIYLSLLSTPQKVLIIL